MSIDRLECVPRNELESLQLRRLAETIRRASVSPLYREILKSCKPSELEISSLDQFRTLPFTTKSQLRDSYPFGGLAVQRERIVRFHASSGTRGKPTLAAYTSNDLMTWADLCARSLQAAGVQPGDVLQNAYGYGLFTGGMGIHYGAEHLGAAVIPSGGGRTSQQITLMQDLHTRILCCTPSYALNIGFALEEAGIDRSTLKLEIGVFGAEPWTDRMRTQIEEKLGLKAVDIYGMSELTGPGVAIECLQVRQGLHIHEDHFLAEVVDVKTAEPVPDGVEGELVMTTLTREAAPLIRFRTGDLTSLTKEKCRCGRTTARMTRVRARIDDMLIIRGVNVYPSEIENILLGIDELAPHYQLVLKREKALDELCVQVEIKDEVHESRFGELKQKVASTLKEHLGLTAGVELKPARSLHRSEGKACRLVDQRQTNTEKV